MSTTRLGAALALVLFACTPTPSPPDASTMEADAAVTLADASVAGNSCTNALPLELPTDGGVLRVTGDATGFGDHAACSWRLGPPAGLGPDVLYRFTTTRALALEAGIDGGTLHLGVGGCAVDCRDFEIAPHRGSPFNRSSLELELPAGEHTLWAEAAGPYAFELRTRELLRGEHCDDPIEVGPDAGTLRLEAASYFDEGWPAAPLGCSFGTCSASISVVLVTTERAGLRTQLSSPVQELSVRAMRGCDETFVTWEREGVVLEPGRHHLEVRAQEFPSVQRSSYPVDLTLAVLPLAPGDTCEAPLALALESADGGAGVLSATASGDTALAFSSRNHSCGELTSNDVFFSLTLAQASDLKAEVTTTAATYRPALGLRSGSCVGGEATCATAVVPGAGATVTATALPAGPYFLSLRAADGSSGSYRLQVDVTPR